MKNSGMSMLGMLFSLLIIAFLTVILLKSMGINGSKNPEKNINAPIEKAKAVECTLKADGLNKEIMTYKITNEELPASLNDITSDYFCPIVNEPYQYDSTTGKVWCPKHDQG
jgi:competence protein ComGC